MHNFCIIRNISTIVSITSIVFELLTIVILILVKGFQRNRFLLLTYVTVACFLSNISYLLPIDEDDIIGYDIHNQNYIPEKSSIICKIQTFLIYYSETCKVILTSIMPYCLYLSAIKNDYLEENKIYFRIICVLGFFIIPLIIPSL
jgi:hypothetical protein